LVPLKNSGTIKKLRYH